MEANCYRISYMDVSLECIYFDFRAGIWQNKRKNHRRMEKTMEEVLNKKQKII